MSKKKKETKKTRIQDRTKTVNCFYYLLFPLYWGVGTVSSYLVPSPGVISAEE